SCPSHDYDHTPSISSPLHKVTPVDIPSDLIGGDSSSQLSHAVQSHSQTSHSRVQHSGWLCGCVEPEYISHVISTFCREEGVWQWKEGEKLRNQKNKELELRRASEKEWREKVKRECHCEDELKQKEMEKIAADIKQEEKVKRECHCEDELKQKEMEKIAADIKQEYLNEQREREKEKAEEEKMKVLRLELREKEAQRQKELRHQKQLLSKFKGGPSLHSQTTELDNISNPVSATTGSSEVPSSTVPSHLHITALQCDEEEDYTEYTYEEEEVTDDAGDRGETGKHKEENGVDAKAETIESYATFQRTTDEKDKLELIRMEEIEEEYEYEEEEYTDTLPSSLSTNSYSEG
ncbi:hypothetical protein ADUPG1_011461, partial [Aduncisulcus paluster]